MDRVRVGVAGGVRVPVRDLLPAGDRVCDGETVAARVREGVGVPAREREGAADGVRVEAGVLVDDAPVGGWGVG